MLNTVRVTHATYFCDSQKCTLKIRGDKMLLYDTYIAYYLWIHWNTRARLDEWHPLAGLNQFSRAIVNAISWTFGSKWSSDLEDQGQWPPFSSPVAYLEQIYYKLSHGQAEFLSQNGQNKLEGQCQWSPFSIPTHFQYQDACLVQIWWF